MNRQHLTQATKDKLRKERNEAYSFDFDTEQSKDLTYEARRVVERATAAGRETRQPALFSGFRQRPQFGMSGGSRGGFRGDGRQPDTRGGVKRSPPTQRGDAREEIERQKKQRPYGPASARSGHSQGGSGRGRNDQ